MLAHDSVRDAAALWRNLWSYIHQPKPPCAFAAWRIISIYCKSSDARFGNFCTIIIMYVLKAVVHSSMLVNTWGLRGVNEIPAEEIVKPTLSELSEPTFNLFKFLGNNLASSKNSPLSMSRTYLSGISGVKPPSACWVEATGRSDDVEDCWSSLELKNGNWPSCSNLASGVGDGTAGSSTTRLAVCWLSKNDDIDCETICVIWAIWSALKLSRSVGTDVVLLVVILACEVLCVRRFLSFSRRFTSTRQPPVEEKLSSRQRFFNSEIDSSLRSPGITVPGDAWVLDREASWPSRVRFRLIFGIVESDLFDYFLTIFQS